MLSPMEPHGTVRFELWERVEGRFLVWEIGKMELLLSENGKDCGKCVFGEGQLEVKFCAYEKLRCWIDYWYNRNLEERYGYNADKYLGIIAPRMSTRYLC